MKETKHRSTKNLQSVANEAVAFSFKHDPNIGSNTTEISSQVPLKLNKTFSRKKTKDVSIALRCIYRYFDKAMVGVLG